MNHSNTGKSCSPAGQALSSAADSFEQTGPGTFKLGFLEAKSRTITASADDLWLHLEARCTGQRANRLPGLRRTEKMLCANAFLPAGMTYCLDTRLPRCLLVGDVLLDALGTGASVGNNVLADALKQQIHEICDAFRASLSPRHSESMCGDFGSLEGFHDPLAVDHELGEVTRQLCDSTGWSYTKRSTGQLAIELDVPNQYVQAHAYQVCEHEFRLGATVEIPGQTSPTSRQAMGIFLLTASRVVRMACACVVAASVVSGEASPTYRWEVVWPGTASRTQFHDGLSALTIACRLTVRELHALCDESIASTYLALRGRSRSES